MRTIILAAAAILSVPTIAAAQSAPAATSAAHYNTATTNIGDLLDDPAAKAVLDKYIPGMTTNEQVDMARGMTLKDIQQYSPDKITDKVLADIDAEFAKMPAKAPAKAPAAGK
jgi:hypothetical protein